MVMKRSSRLSVGKLADLPPEEGRRVEVDGVAVAVFRRGDRVFAVADACPHAGASLSEGFINGNAVVCPWHGWTFDLESGVSPFDDDERVSTYRVVVENGEVFVESGASPAGAPPAADPDGPTGSDR